MQISAIFFAVRWCISADWLNDRDQFLYPNEGWERDEEFQSDCLAFTLFHGQNRITSSEGTNHWIPFTEQEVDAPEAFESHWMTDYIAGRLRPMPKAEEQGDLFRPERSPAHTSEEGKPQPLHFSPEAKAVFDAGRELWRYYMAQPEANANASLYDIRAHFQGFAEKNGKRKMNATSDNAHYNVLISALRSAVQGLGDKLQPKVYAYGFLRR